MKSKAKKLLEKLNRLNEDKYETWTHKLWNKTDTNSETEYDDVELSVQIDDSGKMKNGPAKLQGKSFDFVRAENKGSKSKNTYKNGSDTLEVYFEDDSPVYFKLIK